MDSKHPPLPDLGLSSEESDGHQVKMENFADVPDDAGERNTEEVPKRPRVNLF
jgi:hypothetical protein